jgi:hypothetical protein
MATASTACVDCCRELEQTIDFIREYIGDRWEEEKAAGCYRTSCLPCVPKEAIYFGKPAKIPHMCAIGVLGVGEKMDEGPTLGAGRAYTCCPWNERAEVLIFYWFRETRNDEAHRQIMRMAEVIKRILARNRYLVDPGAGLVSYGKIVEFEIDMGVKVIEAFLGSKHSYAEGSMRLLIDYSEAFAPVSLC